MQQQLRTAFEYYDTNMNHAIWVVDGGTAVTKTVTAEEVQLKT